MAAGSRAAKANSFPGRGGDGPRSGALRKRRLRKAGRRVSAGERGGGAHPVGAGGRVCNGMICFSRSTGPGGSSAPGRRGRSLPLALAAPRSVAGSGPGASARASSRPPVSRSRRACCSACRCRSSSSRRRRCCCWKRCCACLSCRCVGGWGETGRLRADYDRTYPEPRTPDQPPIPDQPPTPLPEELREDKETLGCCPQSKGWGRL